jgi:CheY-like chemotaxis protein
MISIEQINRENDQISITFTVSDTGIGIPSDKISSLFEIFQQLDGSTTRKFGGTGLGLAIVKKLIENMSGTINVESNLGEGSSFCFMLPFKIAMNMNPEQDPVSPADDFIYSGVSILLAEDNKVNQLFMKKLLEKKNCKVDIAETGNVVLEKLSQNTYDLILMDIQMPEMDGYEATSAIRKSEINTGEHIPIIALTANATADDKIKCYQLGMDDYISKPVKSDTLISCIQRNLQN